MINHTLAAKEISPVFWWFFCVTSRIWLNIYG